MVLAAAGYPEAPRKGDAITGIPAESADCVTFHAGTALAGDKLVTAGGRVLCVVGLGDSVRMAQNRAYAAVDMIHFDGVAVPARHRLARAETALAPAARTDRAGRHDPHATIPRPPLPLTP